MAFNPITRLEKILCGVKATPRTRLETAVKTAVDNAGGGGGGGAEEVFAVTADMNHTDYSLSNISATLAEVSAASTAGKLVEMTLTDSEIGATVTVPLAIIVPGQVAEFIGHVVAGDDLHIGMVMMLESGASVTLYPVLPEYNPETDVGKFLTIKSDGRLGWGTPG
jgi:hypothetical protein